MMAEPLPARQHRCAILAQAPSSALQTLWAEMGLDPAFELLRGPDTGLVSLRGQIGGGGAPFPFGDATATRASVRLEDGQVGHAMMLGRDHKKAIIAAVVDALCWDETASRHIDAQLIAPLEAKIADRDTQRHQETAATRVDFFTLVRGED